MDVFLAICGRFVNTERDSTAVAFLVAGSKLRDVWDQDALTLHGQVFPVQSRAPLSPL